MKKIFLLLMVMTSISLCSCSSIEDTNGPDDYSLCYYTEDDIKNGIKVTSSFGSASSHIYLGDKLSGSYSVMKLSGYHVIDNYSTKDNSIKFNIEFTCESGNGLCVIMSGNVIVARINANETYQKTISNEYKSYRLVLVGESAKAKVKYEIEGVN